MKFFNEARLKLSKGSQEPDIHMQEATLRWNLATRVAFRFLFVYLGLWCLNLNLIQDTILLVTGKFSEWGSVDLLWRSSVPWFGRHFLHVNIAGGRGSDSPFEWVKILFMLVIAATATVVWSVLDRARPNYARLHQWLRVVVRLTLAGAMISYGANKVYPFQFGGPLSLSRLSTSLGSLTPAAMLWAFMAASTGYTIFGGLGELTSAILLIVPRLANLGALVVIGVMANVFAMNVFYDVEVKIYSFHFLMMGVFLIAPELRRLADVLVFNRTVQSALRPQLFQRRLMNQIALGAQLVLGGLFLVASLHAQGSGYASWREYVAQKSPLYGIWIVNDFEVAGNPQALSGEKRWHRLIFEDPRSVYVVSSIGETYAAELKLDDKQNRLTVTPSDQFDANDKQNLPTLMGSANLNLNANFHFERLQSDELVLDGDIAGNNAHIVLQRVEAKFPLTDPAIHWVQ
jgi:hypothetical protein